MEASGTLNLHHRTAVVDPRAELAQDVRVEAFAVIEDGVRIGAGCRIGPHAVIRRGVTLEEGTSVDAHAVIGGLPQDYKFDPRTPSMVCVGPETIIREGVTIHRSTRENGVTRIGRACLLMAYAHVGHDCAVGNRVVIANNVMFGGHVVAEDDIVLGGGVAVHQFVRIGEGAIVGGGARAARDVPRYCNVSERDEIHGLNLIGLKRRGVKRESVVELKRLYFQVFKGGEGGPARRATVLLEQTPPETEEGRRFLSFFANSQRGFGRPPRHAG